MNSLIIKWFVVRRLANQSNYIDALLDIACNNIATSSDSLHRRAFQSFAGCTGIHSVFTLRSMCRELQQIAEKTKGIEPLIENSKCKQCGKRVAGVLGASLHITRKHSDLVETLASRLLSNPAKQVQQQGNGSEDELEDDWWEEDYEDYDEEEYPPTPDEPPDGKDTNPCLEDHDVEDPEQCVPYP